MKRYAEKNWCSNKNGKIHFQNATSESNSLFRKLSTMLQGDKTVVYVYSQRMEFCSYVGLSHERVMRGAKLQEQVPERFVWS
jgi:hypothetical protein